MCILLTYVGADPCCGPTVNDVRTSPSVHVLAQDFHINSYVYPMYPGDMILFPSGSFHVVMAPFTSRVSTGILMASDFVEFIRRQSVQPEDGVGVRPWYTSDGGLNDPGEFQPVISALRTWCC
jgi:hypothetical protein